ncbi:MAG TPA: DNA polymerase III subunit [Pirellulaceae bacterium]|nr:DNA polymerase III subunit [Pirellulaceae bacterium]
MWHSICGHDRVVEQFRTALSRGRLASTFLFVGPPGVGKRRFALKLAQGLLCDTRPEAALDPCGKCPACQQVEAGTHPDVHVVQPPADASNLPLELFIGDKEHRMRAGLCYELSLKPFSGKRRVGIIDDADLLALGSRESANSLLKTLEEPPPHSVLILIGTSQQRQLPTIRSRCQIVRFEPLSEAEVAELLLSQDLCSDPALAQEAARLSGGSLTRAAMWCDEAVIGFRQELIEHLSRSELDQLPLAKLVQQFVDAAGKEAPAKRARMREAAQMATEFYRAKMQAAAERGGDAEPAAHCQELCLDALSHVDANVNLTTLIEWLVDELAMADRVQSPKSGMNA